MTLLKTVLLIHKLWISKLSLCSTLSSLGTISHHWFHPKITYLSIYMLTTQFPPSCIFLVGRPINKYNLISTKDVWRREREREEWERQRVSGKNISIVKSQFACRPPSPPHSFPPYAILSCQLRLSIQLVSKNTRKLIRLICRELPASQPPTLPRFHHNHTNTNFSAHSPFSYPPKPTKTHLPTPYTLYCVSKCIIQISNWNIQAHYTLTHTHIHIHINIQYWIAFASNIDENWLYFFYTQDDASRWQRKAGNWGSMWVAKWRWFHCDIIYERKRARNCVRIL